VWFSTRAPAITEGTANRRRERAMVTLKSKDLRRASRLCALRRCPLPVDMLAVYVNKDKNQ